MLDMYLYDRDGYCNVEKALPKGLVGDWFRLYGNFFETRTVNPAKPNEVAGPFDGPLKYIYRHPAIVNIAKAIFGQNVALYNYRFIVKDQHHNEATFLHQDCGYHRGFMNKASLLVALHDQPEGCGRMIFYNGTHKLGYLGDAGQILSSYRSSTELALSAGDVVIMNSMLWHESGRATTSPRIMADIIVQPSDDPSGIELLAGEWRTDTWLTQTQEQMFVRSRVSTIKRLQAEVDQLKGKDVGTTGC